MAGQPNNSWWDIWDCRNTSDPCPWRNMSGRDVSLKRTISMSDGFYPFFFYTIVMGTLIVVGVIGNSLAFVVFWKDNIKTSAPFLFQSLALVDTAVLLIAFANYTVPSYFNRIGWLEEHWLIIEVVYVRPLFILSTIASIYITVLFAVNRYIAVCFPLKSLRWCNISNVKKQLVIVLLFAVLVNIPIFAEYSIVYNSFNNGTTYKADLREGTFVDEVYNVFYYLAFYNTVILAVPLAILTVLTIRLIKALKTSRRNQMEMLNRRQKHDNNSTFLLIIVVVVFTICQVPLFIHRFIQIMNICDVRCPVFYYIPVVFTLPVLNSAVNFVIYVIFNKRFRHVLTQTVYASACCHSTGDGSARRRQDVQVGILEMRHGQPRE